jgi:hypothetical protein
MQRIPSCKPSAIPADVAEPSAPTRSTASFPTLGARTKQHQRIAPVVAGETPENSGQRGLINVLKGTATTSKPKAVRAGDGLVGGIRPPCPNVMLSLYGNRTSPPATVPTPSVGASAIAAAFCVIVFHSSVLRKHSRVAGKVQRVQAPDLDRSQ